MVKSGTKQIVGRAVRTVAGNNSRVEVMYRQWSKRRVRRVQGEEILEHHGPDFLVIRSRTTVGPPKGIYLFGGCDLPSLYRMGPLLREDVVGSLAFYQPPGGLGATRSDRQLQLLDEGTPPDAAELMERLRLPPRYFEPMLFEPTFDMPVRGAPAFPKTVVALSAAADIIRPLYRRKSTGTLVDPGGWWLNQSVEAAVADQETLSWMKDEFEPLGRPSIEDFTKSFGRLVREIREHTGTSSVLVLNTLTVEPSDPTHNYQFRPKAEAIRRRSFCLALEELSSDGDFLLLDVDRALKATGVDEQLDFAHFPEYAYQPLANVAHRLLTDSGAL